MIIVLGESVAALVLTAAQTEWTRDFVGTSIAGFLLLVLLWLLTFSYGFSSAPGVRPGSMPPRFGLPLHLASTLGILLIGVGLGEAVVVLEPLHGLMLWVHRRRGRAPLRRLARRRSPRPRAVRSGSGAARCRPSRSRSCWVSSAPSGRSATAAAPGLAAHPAGALAVPLRAAVRRPAGPATAPRPAATDVSEDGRVLTDDDIARMEPDERRDLIAQTGPAAVRRRRRPRPAPDAPTAPDRARRHGRGPARPLDRLPGGVPARRAQGPRLGAALGRLRRHRAAAARAHVLAERRSAGRSGSSWRSRRASSCCATRGSTCSPPRPASCGRRSWPRSSSRSRWR